MPELHNIQAYLSLDKRSPGDALDAYGAILRAHALLTPDVQAWLQSFQWSEADDGLVYPSGQRWTRFVSRGVSLDVAPHVLGWTPRTIPALHADWLEVGLLLKTEDISFSSPDDWRYRPEVARAVYQLVAAFLPISVDAPSFPTDELQDGKPWESWIADGHEPWAFDLAVVADGVAWPTQALPADFGVTTVKSGRAIARKAIWTSLPWEL